MTLKTRKKSKFFIYATFFEGVWYNFGIKYLEVLWGS